MAAFCAACDDAPDDPLRVEVESEFFAASGMETDALRDEIAQRSRRRRKLELGRAYFSPRVLRAIVTYNAALVARIGDELPELMDPDTLAATPGPHRDPQPGSVFRSEPLRQLAAATRRRLDGAAPASGLADRIVALLGLDDLEDQERKALSSPAVGTEEDPLGTAILVGLLSRSVTVLSIELQELGLMADTVSDDWLDELGALFQQEIHRHLANDAYPVACRLSELRNRFLIAASQDARDASDLECGPHGRRNAASSTVAYARASPPAGGPAAQAEGEAPGSRAHAREIMRDALEWQRASRRGDHDRSAASHLPWARLGRATALAAVALVAAIGLLTWRDPGPLDGLGRARLEAVSAHLQSGRLDARAGSGSFVGRIDEAWAALPADRREAVAREIVERLRHQGLQQIMIYDDDGRVRIQALGSQPIRVL